MLLYFCCGVLRLYFEMLSDLELIKNIMNVDIVNLLIIYIDILSVSNS